MLKYYLGNGVYVETDGFGLVLTTSNGKQTTNIIYLEPQMCQNLVEYLTKFVAVAKAALAKGEREGTADGPY